MKLRLVRFSLITCAIALAATVAMAAQPAQSADKTVSVGDFVVRMADTFNPAHNQITTLDQAKHFFAGRGVLLPASLDMAAPLTEQDVTIVTSLLGLDVKAQEPGRVFTSESIDGFVGYLRENLDSGRIPVDSKGAPPLSISANGACCINGVCSQATPDNCRNAGGVYKGKGIPCSPDPCAQGMAQCCLGGHSCTITTFADCTGVWTGKDSCFPSGNACRNPVPATPTEP